MLPIRVMAVDDHPMVRAGVRSTLLEHPDIVLVAEATDGADAFYQLSRLDPLPHIMLLDLAMPRMDGLQVLAALPERFPTVAVIIITGSAQTGTLAECLIAGARGYVLKDQFLEMLPLAIRVVYHGGAHWTSGGGATRPDALDRAGAHDFEVRGPGVEQPGDRAPAHPVGSDDQEARTGVAGQIGRRGPGSRRDHRHEERLDRIGKDELPEDPTDPGLTQTTVHSCLERTLFQVEQTKEGAEINEKLPLDPGTRSAAGRLLG